MLIKKTLPMMFRELAGPAHAGLAGQVQYSYIKQKDIDEIMDQFPERSLIDYMKIGIKIAKLLVVEGFKDGKADFVTWK